MSEVSRPWRSRVWFYKPELYWYGWKTLRPVWYGGDEFNWHTVVIGWNLFGQAVIATEPCRGEGRCAEELNDPDMKPEWVLATPWPVDMFGHDHSGGPASDGSHTAIHPKASE